jgi:RimJ/RimL family protein N-acetyltransferase
VGEFGGITGLGPRLQGRHIALRPVVLADYDELYLAEQSEGLGPLWRLEGTTPRPDRFVDSLWVGVTAQFVVVQRGSARPIGIVTLYDADHRDQFAYFMAADLRNEGRPTRVAQALVLFLAYVFYTWPFRKLYLKAMEYNLDQYRSMCGRLLVEEGRLREHHHLAGRYWDEVTFAIYRDTWAKWESRALKGLLPPP